MDRITKLFNNKIALWKQTYSVHTTPWDYFSLRISSNATNTYWLNPQNQSFVSSGTFSSSELELFLEGTGPIPVSKLHFIYLNLVLRIDRYYSLLHYSLKHYNFYDRDFHGKDFLKPKKSITEAIKKGELTKDLIKDIEVNVKLICNEFTRYLNDTTLEPQNPESFRTLNEYISNQHRREVQRRSIYTYLTPYAQAGILYYNGATNTPTERKNINWWADLLDSEIICETILKSGVFTDDEIQFILDFNNINRE